MARYVVMQPPPDAGFDPVEGVRILKDGFHAAAFLVPPVWLAWRGLWLEAALALTAGLGLAALGEAIGLGLGGSALSFLLSIYVGLEGPALHVAALRRRGWRDWGVIDADNFDDAEARYAAWIVGDDETAGPLPSSPGLTAAPPSPRMAGPALGLLAYPVRG